jgi:hypothetical protein
MSPITDLRNKLKPHCSILCPVHVIYVWVCLITKKTPYQAFVDFQAEKVTKRVPKSTKVHNACYLNACNQSLIGFLEKPIASDNSHSRCNRLYTIGNQIYIITDPEFLLMKIMK